MRRSEVIGGVFHPILTTAFISRPHRCTEDDFYEGYFIPKGTVIIPNVWEMNRDPQVFGADALDFNPGRYLDDRGEALPSLPGAKDADGHYTFGRFIADSLA